MRAVEYAFDADTAAPTDELALFHCEHGRAEGRLAVAGLDGDGEPGPLGELPVEPGDEWVPLVVFVGGGEDLPDPAWGASMVVARVMVLMSCSFQNVQVVSVGQIVLSSWRRGWAERGAGGPST